MGPDFLATIAVEGRIVPTPSFASPARAHAPRWLAALERPEHHAFHLDARSGGGLGIEWTIDGRAFAGHGAGHPAALSLDEGRFYRLRFVNDSARLHPIHLQRMFFRLLARDAATVEPFFRDTVLVHGRESIDIGLVAWTNGLRARAVRGPLRDRHPPESMLLSSMAQARSGRRDGALAHRPLEA